MADWLERHVAEHNADPGRTAICVSHWLDFFASERKAGRLTRDPVVKDIDKPLVDRFIKRRLAQRISPATISRELAALRAPLTWAWKAGLIESAPFVQDVAKKAPPKELTYSPEQVARLLEAAYRLPERRHVHLFIMIMLSTHGRGEAILELHSDQIANGLINFNAPGRAQTKKRRSIVPIAPTLAPWLDGIEGKVIRYRAPIAPEKWADADVPEYFERDCYSIKTAFEACLIEAGICEQAFDADGKPLTLPARAKLGETKPRPKLVGIGNPNTLRHTISTEMHRRGVDERQIDAAAGHASRGTNKKNYMHLRPDYLNGFIAGVEEYWAEVGQHTRAHLRSQCDPKIVSIASRRKVAK